MPFAMTTEEKKIEIIRKIALRSCYQCYMPYGISGIALRQRKRHIAIPRLRIQLPSATRNDDILLTVH